MDYSDNTLATIFHYNRLLAMELQRGRAQIIRYFRYKNRNKKSTVKHMRILNLVGNLPLLQKGGHSLKKIHFSFSGIIS